jgi:PPOX class probable F420-dependent enzyme
MMSTTVPTAIDLQVQLRASAQRAYQAWLDPSLVQRWMAPGDSELTRVEIEPRVGGPYRIWKAHAGRLVGGFDSELLELIPDRRLVFRWGFIGPERRQGPSFDTLLTVTLEPSSPEESLLILEHRQLDELAAAMPEVARHVGGGWEDVLGKLAVLLAAGEDAAGPRDENANGRQLPSEVRRLLEGPNQAHIATLLPDGGPHSVPVWVGLEDAQIAVLTSPGSRKARNLSRDPRVAISITDRDRPTSMASVRGRVTEMVDGEKAWEIIDRISHKYIGQPYPLREDRIVFLIEAEHAFAQAFG